jgi:GT2 family glycosyltransferase
MLETHLAAATQGSGVVSIGPLAAPADWQPSPWNRWELETLACEYRQMERGAYPLTWRQFFTGNALVRRHQFLEAGGFNESFKRAEDIELAYRMWQLGCTFVFTPGATGWHYADRSLASWRAIPGQYARFDREIDALHTELGWLATVTDERRRRHPATRLALQALRRARLERVGASAALATGRALSVTRAYRAGTSLLSLAYELEYTAAARALGPIPPVNSRSTLPA